MALSPANSARLWLVYVCVCVDMCVLFTIYVQETRAHAVDKLISIAYSMHDYTRTEFNVPANV